MHPYKRTPVFAGIRQATPSQLQQSDASSGYQEVKTLLDNLGKNWEEFKKTNDELLKAKADGKSITDIEAKLEKINKAMDENQTSLSRIDSRWE